MKALDILQSEKGMLALVLLAGATALMLAGKMTLAQWQEFSQWIFGSYVAGKTITAFVPAAGKAKK